MRNISSAILGSLFFMIGVLPGAFAQTPSVTAVNLIAPLRTSSAQLQFHEGQTDAAGNILIDPVLPAVPGPKSPWIFSQWNHAIYTRPTDLELLRTPNAPTMTTFFARDFEAGLIIQQLAINPGLTFTIYNSDGTLTDGGGRATYLSTGTLPGVTTTFDQEIDLKLNAGLPIAHITYFNKTAQSTGAVMGMAYTGIGLMFLDPTGVEPAQFVFMQIGLTLSRPQPADRPGFMCAGNTVVLFSPATGFATTLPFKPGPMRPITHNLSAAVAQMLASNTPCGGNTAVWDAAKRTLANWHFAGLYIGSETENVDLRPGAATASPQGHVELALQLADLSVTRRIP